MVNSLGKVTCMADVPPGIENQIPLRLCQEFKISALHQKDCQVSSIAAVLVVPTEDIERETSLEIEEKPKFNFLSVEEMWIERLRRWR